MKGKQRKVLALMIVFILFIQIVLNVLIPIKSIAVDYLNSSSISEIKVGDYINYTPDASAAKSYPKSKLGATITGQYNSKDIEQDKLSWQVLRIYDNGSMDLIGSETSTKLDCGRALGYNNGVWLMNDICESLYSREGIKARSVNLHDMELWLTEKGKEKRQNYIYPNSGKTTYGNPQTYLDSFGYYPNLYAKEKGQGINSDTASMTGIDCDDKGYNTPTTETYTKANKLTVTQTYYEISMSTDNYGEGANVLDSDKEYWIASRGVICGSDKAIFGIWNFSKKTYGLCHFFSDGEDNFTDGYLRPVVSLDKNIRIIPCKGTNSETNPHIINWDNGDEIQEDIIPPTVNVTNSITTPTNQNVTVTITADKQIKPLQGWTLDSTQKILSKQYEENQEEEITIEDLAGNTTKVKVKVDNIDKIAPEIKVKYSNTQPTTERVKVTITSNEEIQIPTGWILDEENNVIYKEYDANTEETIQIKDLAGNATETIIKIENIIKENGNNNNNDKKGNNVNNSKGDNTVSGKILPKTGAKIGITAIIVIFIYGLIQFIKYRKYKDIK